MYQNQKGAVDWSAVAALAACATAVAALIVALVVVTQMRQDAARVQFNTGLDSLWHFDAQWNSDGMLDARSAAAAALLDGRPTHDIDDVLDFFDQTGAAHEPRRARCRHGLLRVLLADGQLLVRQSGVRSPSAARRRRRVGTARHDRAPPAEIEQRRRKRTSTAPVPTKAQIGDFLRAEVRSGECVDDDADADAQKVPL